MRLVCLAACLGVAMIGCAPSWHPPKDEDRLPKRVRHTSDAKMNKQMQQLNAQGVTVITMGQNYLISIPTARIFADQSPLVLWPAYDTLNDVSAFLAQFRKVAATITVYGGTAYQSKKRELALSQARASFLAKYFWSQGLDARLLFSVGAGATHPIIMGGTQSDQSPNSRVEITFKNEVA